MINMVVNHGDLPTGNKNPLILLLAVPIHGVCSAALLSSIAQILRARDALGADRIAGTRREFSVVWKGNSLQPRLSLDLRRTPAAVAAPHRRVRVGSL